MKFIFGIWLDTDRGKKFIQVVYFIYFALMFNVIYIWLQLTTAVQVKGMFSYLYLASILQCDSVIFYNI